MIEIIDANRSDMRWIVIDASAITQIDTTGAEALLEVKAALHSRGIVLALAEVQSDVAALLKRAGLSSDDGATLFFDDVEDAFDAFMASEGQHRLTERGPVLSGDSKVEDDR